MNTLNKAILLALVSFPVVCSAQAGGCEAKRDSIEKEIAYAQANGNTNRIDGLKTALAKMNANCTDEGLRSEAQRKVVEAQEKLAERQHDLDEAKEKGKSPEKIAERQRKVDEAHADLQKRQVEAAQ